MTDQPPPAVAAGPVAVVVFGENGALGHVQPWSLSHRLTRLAVEGLNDHAPLRDHGATVRVDTRFRVELPDWIG